MITMSCSDKLAACNVLGVLGEIVSNLLDPIHFDSMVIGDRIKLTHLEKAIHRRYESTLKSLLEPQKCNHPQFSRPSFPTLQFEENIATNERS
jgi:double stranded RNA-specific editase B